MHLTRSEERMLAGEEGYAAQKSMEILVALGEIYEAERLIDVSSVQISGVAYKSLGDAGIEFLEEMARDGRARVKSTLNPCGMDLENWERLGISPEYAEKQLRAIEAFRRLGVTVSCTCTPYLAGNRPKFGRHLAWSESSAVAYANSAIGAMTNREGGPSSLAAAIIGKTPYYGFHLKQNRAPTIRFDVEPELGSDEQFSALGYYAGALVGSRVPLFTGIRRATVPQLKALAAGLASSGAVALFHIDGVTPEARLKAYRCDETASVTERDLKEAVAKLNDPVDPDFICIGCPHCSLSEIARIAELLAGKTVGKEVWICVSRAVRKQAEAKGYAQIIERSGAKLASDTCMVVAPVEDLGFKAVMTNSAKACHYSRNLNRLSVRFASLPECLQEAVR